MRWILGVVSGTLLTLVGFVIVLANVAWVMRLAGAVGSPPPPQAGDATWVGIAFARSFGGALVALGILTFALSRLEGEAARKVRLPFMIGLALLAALLSIQALAIWSTPSAWVLSALVALACVSALTWGVTHTALHPHR
jgi:hypothetical protein